MCAIVAPTPQYFGAVQAQGDTRSSLTSSAELTGLRAVLAKRVVVGGKEAVEIVFDEPSAERFRQFANGAVGHRIVFFVDQRKLAALRLVEPLAGAKAQLTGDFDRVALESILRSPNAVIDLKLE